MTTHTQARKIAEQIREEAEIILVLTGAKHECLVPLIEILGRVYQQGMQKATDESCRLIDKLSKDYK